MNAPKTQKKPTWQVLNKEQYIHNTFLKMRKAIGYLGISLPISLVILSYVSFFETEVQESISHFYYTNFREIFTGTLCSVGLFMLLYEGFRNEKWWKNDTLLTNIAGAMAFGVAFFPTNPLLPCDKVDSLIPHDWGWLSGLHYGFAAVLFLAFACLSYFAFTIGQAESTDIRKSIFNENNIYKGGGILIVLFVIMVPVSPLLTDWEYTTLLFEFLALFVFGVIWLIKGRALGDKGKIGEKLYMEKNPK